MGVSVIRVNVSIPQKLKERMDAVAESVNWSAVATAAFEAKLLELESRKKGVKEMRDVVARLRAAAELESNRDYQDGKQAGERWAKVEAAPRQLRRLEKADENGTLYISDDIGGRLSEVLNTSSGMEREPDEGFWWVILGDDAGRIADHAFVGGFKDGALDVWRAVKDEL
jgi:hypothetical protein